MRISAYIPCYNAAATLARAIDGVKRQEIPVDELFVVDDGSTDDSTRVAEHAGVRVVSMNRRMGRGAVRARAMDEARHPLVLSCDATIELPRDFVSRALHWLEDDSVVAVTGRIGQREMRGVVDRWRVRHLFRTEKRREMSMAADLVTTAAMMRADAVREAGGYDKDLLHGEDADLSRRLLAPGDKVVFDPAMTYWQLGSNTLFKVLERYWRWNRAAGRLDFEAYCRQVKYAVTVMAREDMETADIGAAMISLLSPHYQYWRDLRE